MLTPYPVAAGIVFLLLIYVAVHARRCGARGQGVGVFGFMAFFLSQFTGARVVSDERRMRHGRPSPEQRLLLHTDRLDATLTALARALDPPAPGTGRPMVRSKDGTIPLAAQPDHDCRCADLTDRCEPAPVD